LTAETSSRKSNLLRWAKLLFRLTVLALVTVGIWRTVVKAIDDLQTRGFEISEVRPGWLVAAGLLYLLGLLPCWWFWHRTLQAMGQRPRRLETLRAFYIGHLGKYVPGKALVVVLRTDLVRSERVNTTVAATSVFVETLTMMGVGAFVAAALLGALFRDQVWLLGLAIGLMLCAGVPTLPPIFRRLVRMLGVRRVNPDIDAALAGLDYRLMAFGWITVGLGWWLLGLSLWAVLKALPTPVPVLLYDVPLLTACVALALVAGFLSLLPGGIGIREYVVMTLLAGPFGPGAAAVSAILLRFVWLLGELMLAGILYAWKLPVEVAGSLERKVES
jgi:glycosyltransferase 2 family protein